MSLNRPFLASLLLLFISTGQGKLLEDREVICSSERMVINLSFSSPFSGVVFAQNRFSDLDCQWKGNGGHYLLVLIPLDYNSSSTTDEGFCGLSFNQKTGEHSMTLIISPDPVILTEESFALSAHCVQKMSEDFMITLDPPNSEPAFKIAKGESMMVEGSSPTNSIMRLKLLGDHGIKGDVVGEATVGQRITLDAQLDDTSIFDMFVHDCIAHDGTHSSDASIPIIDGNGCAVKLLRAIDQPVFSTPLQKNTGKHVYVHMYGFQFTSSEYVHFECKVTTCANECPMKQCQNEKLLPVPATGNKLNTLVLKTLLRMVPQTLNSQTQAMQMFDKSDGCIDPSMAALVCFGTVVIFFILAYFTRKLIYSYNDFLHESQCP